ncbi:ty3-gypsy retrotransposon protein [Cucumis melo var. makuwa]|uniref:Ty3-gypsy retrotransposon protein n=1 Tax=Cucumis melo var. makuwa TaxID=1194695 RepID=A0A5A7UK38_CUCMM|nr:ty3-gypsy retrotransposon protein [Cucumis melo var. makuwa]TYJ95720.1 ty3-gypsy retrotransposon protein [Cucumis melo var. makuwa]
MCNGGAQRKSNSSSQEFNMDYGPYLVEKRRLVEAGQGENFSISSDDGLTFAGRLCVPEDGAVKIELLTEAHSSPFTMHPGSTKMYQDLRRVYW